MEVSPNYLELKLYLIVLDMQNKQEKILEILNGDWGNRMKIKVEREKLKVTTLERLQRWRDLLNVTEKLLAEE